MTEQKKPSFFGTLPGILTAFAAILTAIGALLISLDKVGYLDDADAKEVPVLITQNTTNNPDTLNKPSEKTTTTDFTGQWVFSKKYIAKLTTNGNKSKVYRRRSNEDTIKLIQKGNHLSGHILWTTKSCSKASLEGTIDKENIDFILTYSGVCCTGTSIQFQGKLTTENYIVGKFKPKGLPLENCETFWADVTASRS